MVSIWRHPCLSTSLLNMILKKVGAYTFEMWPPVKQVCRKGLRSMGWKRVLSCFNFCTSNPFGKLASQAKGQVKVIKTEQLWENLWCVIYLFLMEEMNPADSMWQWAAIIRQSVQILQKEWYCHSHDLYQFLGLYVELFSHESANWQMHTQTHRRDWFYTLDYLQGNYHQWIQMTWF